MASQIIEERDQNPEQKQGAATGRTGGSTQRSKLVQRLLDASANLPQFVNDLLTTQAVVVAGTEAAGFLIEKREVSGQVQFGLKSIAHIRPDQSTPEIRAAAVNAFQEIIRPCIAQAKDGAIEIQGGEAGAEPQFCLVTLLRNEGDIVAASAVITRCLNVERAQQRLMSMQLVAGYFELYTLRRASEQSMVVAQSHQHVLQLAGSVATAEGFDAGSMNLCNELANRTQASRVSIGWYQGRRIKVKALSHTEKFDKKQELTVAIQKAMEECFDQEEPVQYVPDGTGSANVTRDAAALARSQGGEVVLSLPLRRRSEIVGVVTLEFPADKKLTEQAQHGLGVAVDLLAPQLYDRFSNDRYLITKVGVSIRENTKKLVGPTHTLPKVLIISFLLLAWFLSPWSIYVPMHRVSGQFQFSPIEKRDMGAPYDGYLAEFSVRPGDKVKVGDVLVRMDTKDIELRRNESQSRVLGLRRQADAYGADPSKTADRMVALAQMQEAQSQVELFDQQIRRATIVSPINGEVLKGDLRDKVGSPVKQGDVVMEVADRSRLRVELSVNERDIQEVQIGQKGRLATSSLPGDKYPFLVNRIVPLGEAKEGTNVFRVFGELDPTSEEWTDEMRTKARQWAPGLQGEARIDIEKASIFWQWTHRLVDFVRLKTWM